MTTKLKEVEDDWHYTYTASNCEVKPNLYINERNIYSRMSAWSNSLVELNWDIEGERPLLLDFGPFRNICEPNCIFPIALVHWQARPKYARRWGVYIVSQKELYTAEYIVADALRLEKESRTIQLDEYKITTIPTAVILIEAAKIKILNSGEHITVLIN